VIEFRAREIFHFSREIVRTDVGKRTLEAEEA
jgi:hypothetical protein